MKTRVPIYLWMILLSVGSFSPITEAYEEITVKNGGSLQGHITLQGEVPKPKAYNLVTLPDPVFCGRISNGNGWRLLQPFNVGSQGEFRDVVVVLKNIEKGKPVPKAIPEIEAIDCLFAPFITIVYDQRPVKVSNVDPVFHDIQAYETSSLGARVLFNTPLPMNPRYSKSSLSVAKRGKRLSGKPILQKVRMTKGRNIFVMQCGFHAYMESWAYVVDHPYIALTDENGRYSIEGIPPGTYQALVWHPVAKAGKGIEFEVTIQPNQASTLDVSIDAPKGRLYANQLEKNPRFGLDLMGNSEIIPSVELQKY